MALAHRAKVKDPAKAFISTWRTSIVYTGSTANNQIKLPLEVAGTYKFTVQWGDGTSNLITTWNQAETTHTYPAPGDYTVTITGFIKGWDFGQGGTVAPTTGDMRKLLTITQFGCLRFVTHLDPVPTQIWGAFYGCTNLTLTGVQDMPNFKGTTSTQGFLRLCAAITTINNINKWDVSKIQIFRSMLREMILFNDNVGNWNTSNATNFITLFAGVTATSPYGSFNNGGSSSIKNWDTSNVTNMASTFSAQPLFNQEVGLWNVGKVTNMSFMFSGSSATYPCNFDNAGSDSIGNWDLSNVTTIRTMFQAQYKFNRNISNWNISNVTDMGFFLSANMLTGIFNQDLSNWDTSKVTNMDQSFYNQRSFNQNLGSWNTSNVTTLFGMLGGSGNGSFTNGGSDSIKNWNTGNVTNLGFLFQNQINFNHDIGNWNTSKVTNLRSMFINASAFNQDINTKTVTVNGNTYQAWNTALVTDMRNVFDSATSFNQPINNWNVSAVTTITNFMLSKTNLNYSAANYDALLIGWASRPVKPNLSINFGTIKYTAAASAARAILTSAPNNWTIVDGGI